ncbi:MAG: hypothetical protein ACOCXZ_01225 [Chloroflexota bacterium]
MRLIKMRRHTMRRKPDQHLPEAGSALLVSYGGFLEATAAGCLPDAAHARFGPYIDYCEGIRLAHVDGAFTDGEILRVGHELSPGCL